MLPAWKSLHALSFRLFLAFLTISLLLGVQLPPARSAAALDYTGQVEAFLNLPVLAPESGQTWTHFLPLVVKSAQLGNGDLHIVRVLQGNPDVTSQLSISPDGALLASGSLDGKLHLWRLSDFSTPCMLAGHTAEVTALQFSPDSQFLASSADAQISIWNTVTCALVKHLDQTRSLSDIHDLAYAPNGQVLFSPHTAWLTADWSEIPDFKKYPQSDRMALSSDGKLLASFDDMNYLAITLYNTSNFSATAELGLPEAFVYDLAFSPDGKMLAAVPGSSSVLAFWNTADGSELPSLHLSENGNQLYFTPDGLYVFSLGQFSWLSAWRLSDQTQVYARQDTGIEHLAVGPQGLVVSGGSQHAPLDGFIFPLNAIVVWTFTP